MAESEAKSEESGESSRIRREQSVIEGIPWPDSREEYKLEEIIGNGSISIVYRSICIRRKEICAIKRINLEKYNLTQLGNEIKALKACRHRNIVSYYTSFYTGDVVWIVMRLLDRGSLRQIMDRLITSMGGRQALKRGLLSQHIIATIIKDVLNGLEYIHDSELIHGDIKTSNILISSEGNVQLADFGLSVWVQSEERTRKKIPGTVCYLAPEIAVLHDDDLEMDNYTSYIDIWSLGITTLEMVIGYPPYHNKIASMTVKWIRQNDPPCLEMYESCDYTDYGKKYRHFLSSCLKKSAKQRWTVKKLITHPFITSIAQDSEYLTETLLEISRNLTHEQCSTTAELPPIIDIIENMPNQRANVMWDFDSGTEEVHRNNRINKKFDYIPVRVPPNAEISMSVNLIECGDKGGESETLLMAAKIVYNCKYSIEDQIFQLAKEKKLEPKFMVIVAANLSKVATAAQRQNLEGKYFAFVIEKRREIATVLEICITVWCYTTDHRH